MCKKDDIDASEHATVIKNRHGYGAYLFLVRPFSGVRTVAVGSNATNEILDKYGIPGKQALRAVAVLENAQYLFPFLFFAEGEICSASGSRQERHSQVYHASMKRQWAETVCRFTNLHSVDVWQTEA